ncbi:L-fuconolactonase [Actinoplanes tereljensis]|uniref:Amidohydrolase n=1 Tax=Paractinoplanes tereljensis TaxID=571912 RepID=A0A919NNL8_9ACTN|nr:amidohydrolase family protein [Actinoplanes tereljensis]GIF20862.1 amidohydrolase [Actinoplanes tereljensis]
MSGPVIDAHQHLWRVEDGYTWLDDPALKPIRRTFTPADLRAQLAANGVDRSILVEGGRCDPDEAAVLLGYAAATPEIAGVVAWADPEDPGLAETIAGYRRLPGGHRLVGIRSQVQAEPDPFYLDRASVREGLRVIGSLGLAFDLVIRADQLPAAARCARALPSVRFALDHLGKPPIRAGEIEQWAADLAGLAACDNVTAKLSGLVTEADWESWTAGVLTPYISTAVDLFGVDRLMFGSDWPVCELAGGYRRWVTALREVLPERAVFGPVAARTYDLGRE